MPAGSSAPQVPLVSVVVPVYNSGQYLPTTIGSLINQVPFRGTPAPPFEILVVDDRSTDPGTLEVLSRLEFLDPRIHVIHNERSKGAAGARNSAILRASGSWIGFCDSDDLWLETGLASRWHFLENSSHVRWLWAGFFVWRPETGLEERPFSARSPCLYRHIRTDFDAGRLAKLDRPVAMLLTCGCPGVNTVMIRRDLILSLGMFDESLRRVEDYMLWLRCAVEEDLYFAPVDTGIYRAWPGSVTRSGEPDLYLEHRLIEKMREDHRFVAYSESIRRRMIMILEGYCYHYRRQRQYWDAVRWSLALLWEAPLRARSWRHVLAAVIAAR